MAKRSGHTSNQTGGGRHGRDDGKGGGDRRTRDAGAPEEVRGGRANRRAEHTQVVKWTPWGGSSVTRSGQREGNLSDRWHRR
jgi:hypothetical protein